MYLFSALLFALSANIDSFIIGLSCGIQKTKISVVQVILISLITFCGTFAALASGEKLISLFSFPFAEYTGNIILLIFGLYYVAKFLFMRIFCPFLQHKTLTSDACFLSWKSTCLFGLSLSVNNLGIGLGASISGLRLLPASLISFVVCIFFLLLGNHAGQRISFQKSEEYADLFCGLLLILLSFFC